MTDAISEKVAREQLESFLAYYDIETALVPDSTREGYDFSCGKIVKAIQKGRLEIVDSEDGIQINQTLLKPPGEVSKITYFVLSGHAKIAMKGRSEKDYYGRMYALLGSLSKLGEDAIQNLKGPDLTLAECVGTLFLQA